MYILIIIVLLILATGVYAGWQGAPWVPTWSTDIDRFLNLAKIKPGEIIYDLGCGDGRLVKAAASRGGQSIGLEISLLPYLIAKIRQVLAKDKFTIKFENFWQPDLSAANVVYFFQMEKIYEKLGEKLKRELKPGARVIAYVWPIPGWEAKKIDKLAGQPNLYYYEIE